jgi:pimeloyl-ACP methyl ester carboxylesterase
MMARTSTPFLLAIVALSLTFAVALAVSEDAREADAAGTVFAADSDGDGCSDAEELGGDPTQGGMRDPNNRWDFYDVPFQNGSIAGTDFFGILAHFGSTAVSPSGRPRYDPAFDRGTAQGDPWDLQAPDGTVSGTDFFAVLAQFAHTCTASPGYYTIANPAFTPLAGATAFFGSYSGGGYRIEVPNNWNGDLIMWTHGFRGNGSSLTVDLPQLRSNIISMGYAWASSSYRENGLSPGVGARDTLALKDLFTSMIGAPDRVYLVGASMGGYTGVLSAERAQGEYDGILSLCGVVDGVEILDYFVGSVIPVAAFLTGVTLPNPQTAEPEDVRDALNQILPQLGDPPGYTQAGLQLKSIMIHYTGGPRPFDSAGYDQQWPVTKFILTDGLNAVIKHLPPGRNGLLQAVAGNDDVVYHIDSGMGVTDEEINDGVSRLTADPVAQASSEFYEFVPMTGDIAGPLLTMHGTGDLFVPIGLEPTYAAKVVAAGNDEWLLQRSFEHAGHCAFNNADVLDAFNDLVGWVETGIKPPA